MFLYCNYYVMVRPRSAPRRGHLHPHRRGALAVLAWSGLTSRLPAIYKTFCTRLPVWLLSSLTAMFHCVALLPHIDHKQLFLLLVLYYVCIYIYIHILYVYLSLYIYIYIYIYTYAYIIKHRRGAGEGGQGRVLHAPLPGHVYIYIYI